VTNMVMANVLNLNTFMSPYSGEGVYRNEIPKKRPKVINI